MIYQGSNNPIDIQFDADVSAIPALVITLWSPTRQSPNPLKTWTLDNMTVSGDTASCPVTEAETKRWNGRMIIEAKGLDEDGLTIFWDSCETTIVPRRDKVITLTRSE